MDLFISVSKHTNTEKVNKLNTALYWKNEQ